LSIHPLFFDKPLELLERLLGEPFQELKAFENRLLAEYGTELPMNCYVSGNCLVSFNWKGIAFIFIQVTDETNLYCTFSFYGAKAAARLFNCLTLVCKEELESDEFK
jgi:hypothetical protein